MNRIIALIAAIALGAAGAAYALSFLSNTGDWPKDWPKELEPLRKQARTLVHADAQSRHFGIAFTKREELEAAWPHILKVKTKGAPVFLVRSSGFYLGENAKAGIVIHSPPLNKLDEVETPNDSPDMRTRWQYTNYIELVVDGDIGDLNRIPLPADTPIVDERFKDEKGK